MKKNRLLEIIEPLVPILLGLFLVLVGIILVLVSLVIQNRDHSNNAGTHTVLETARELASHLAVAALVAGLLLIAVEPITRIREHAKERGQRRYLRRVRNANSEALLRSLMHESVFQEVQSQIISNPFLRMRYRADITLTRSDSRDEYIREETTLTFRVKNCSKSAIPFIVRAWTECKNTHRGATQICRVPMHSEQDFVLHDPDGKAVSTRNKTLTQKELIDGNYLHDEKDQFLDAKIPLTLEADQELEVSQEYSTWSRSSDHSYIVALGPTTGIEVNVNHPNDLIVKLTTMHPEDAKCLRSNEVTKWWRLERALLPCQGAQIFWELRGNCNDCHVGNGHKTQIAQKLEQPTISGVGSALGEQSSNQA